MTAHSAGWNFDPIIVIPVVALGAGYAIGIRRLTRRPGRTVMAVWAPAAFGGGVMALIAALVSPLDSLSAELLSSHMGQHLLLMLVAAPLLVLGAPAVPLLLALPLRWRQRLHRFGRIKLVRVIRGFLTQPLVVWVLSVIALWSWHAPWLYEAAVQNDAVHILEHTTFLGTSLLFWWVVIDPGRRRLAAGHDVLYVFTAGIQSSMLGALLTFSASPLYGIYVEAASGHGGSALQDQQIAGLIMWIPAAAVYLLAAGTLFVRWLRSVEEEAVRRERAGGRPVRVEA